MIEVHPKLFVGGLVDFCEVPVEEEDWAVLHAAKEPMHRMYVGYEGKGCPQDSPEYLWAARGNNLALNLVDTEDMTYIPQAMINQGLEFIHQHLSAGERVLVHCNAGTSRAPSITLLYLVTFVSDWKGCGAASTIGRFKAIYPAYKPRLGIEDFIYAYWNYYSLQKR